MIRSRAWRLLALVLTVGLVAAGCGSSSSKDTSKKKDNSSTTGAAQLAAATLNGSGSTFQQAFDESVIAAFQPAQPEVSVTYGGGGSGQGQTDLASGLVQWAGTDSLVKDADKSTFQGPFLYFPTVAAPITVSYNLSGVSDLKLSPDTLAKIFDGQITKWNDSAIAADNSGATLPSTTITVAHRSDGSGTTANFTAYLVKAAPTAWTLGTDKVVNWPSGQQAGNGNSGVAQIVKDTNGSIGYVDFSDAKASGLTFAAIKNADGKYVAPSLASTTAALQNVQVAADLTYDPANAPGADSYAIVSPTYIMVYASQSDSAVGAALRGFLDFIYGQGQKIAESVDFAPLPDSILSQAKAQVSKVGA